MPKVRHPLTFFSVLLAACSLDEAPFEVARSEISVRPARSRLDDTRYQPEITDSPETPELQLLSGRLARVPVSRALRTTHVLGTKVGTSHLRVRTQDCEGEEDTGLMVSFTASGAPHTFYNDDHALAGDNGKCSYLDLGDRAGIVTYTIYAFSQRRATANIRLEVDSGNGWAQLVASQPVGGTFIGVGALPGNSFLEVRTRSSGRTGAKLDDTWMVLFAIPNGFADSGADEVTQAAIFSTETPGGELADHDPHVDGDESHAATRNYVLLSKEASGSASNREVETGVDLVRGPSTFGIGSLLTGEGASLSPGRYYVSVRAAVNRPVGYVASAAQAHDMANMPELEDGGHCGAWSASGSSGSYGLDRGQHNERAFTMRVEKRKGTGWAVIAERPVLRGALGGGPGVFSRFAMELTVPIAWIFRVKVVDAKSDVTVPSTWNWERNPAATEVKLASANVYFQDADFTGAEMRNYADLLGTRGDILRMLQRVEEREDQAPFQWDADIIALQEANKAGSEITGWAGNAPDLTYTDLVEEELEARGPEPWSYVRGRDETWSFGGPSLGPGMGPLYLRSAVWPGSLGESVYFSAAAKDAAGCSPFTDSFPTTLLGDAFIDPALEAAYAECPLGDSGLTDIANFAVPGSAEAWRDGTGADRPFAVFNVHLNASDGAESTDVRFQELEDLISRIESLIAVQPTAFNRVGSTSMTHAENRLVILGDFNIRAHQCGEHYPMVARLREAFGYAIDAAMATPDLMGDATLGMHTGEGGYDGTADDWPLSFQYPFWTHPALGVPAWQDAPDFSADSRHPWWASTGRKKTPWGDGRGERYDLVLLVGRGWADDDPVLDYAIMNDANGAQIGSGTLGAPIPTESRLDTSGQAVSMWKDCGPSSVVTGPSAESYAPRWDLGCGTGRGAAALHTDHRPIGVRLRIWK